MCSVNSTREGDDHLFPLAGASLQLRHDYALVIPAFWRIPEQRDAIASAALRLQEELHLLSLQRERRREIQYIVRSSKVSIDFHFRMAAGKAIPIRALHF